MLAWTASISVSGRDASLSPRLNACRGLSSSPRYVTSYLERNSKWTILISVGNRVISSTSICTGACPSNSREISRRWSSFVANILLIASKNDLTSRFLAGVLEVVAIRCYLAQKFRIISGSPFSGFVESMKRNIGWWIL